MVYYIPLPILLIFHWNKMSLYLAEKYLFFHCGSPWNKVALSALAMTVLTTTLGF